MALFRVVARIVSLTLLALSLTGCYVFGFGVARAVPVGPGGSPPTPAIPQIRLEYGGILQASRETFYVWNLSTSSALGSGAVAPGSNPPLVIPAGASVNIVIAPGAPPAVVWVAELDASGVPSHAVALSPASNAVPFTVTHTGRYALQVTAEWTYQNQVTALFDLDVQP